ncbi:hypothetical protein LOTGIDRAFT_170333 [Lottia gigantea]|uniref:Uncharacterized protein n=1 Tax=Lottia gigantea TaxID=225164 RepID=V3YVP5_LOTGI|nr:hypothetical protein LOTGIDRAFT_170333 [Lottia gigantea]ESO82058.1 hypothetical protein LOTGIDRAFT_170333 [Lottia gigantea]
MSKRKWTDFKAQIAKRRNQTSDGETLEYLTVQRLSEHVEDFTVNRTSIQLIYCLRDQYMNVPLDCDKMEVYEQQNNINNRVYSFIKKSENQQNKRLFLPFLVNKIYNMDSAKGIRVD